MRTDAGPREGDLVRKVGALERVFWLLDRAVAANVVVVAHVRGRPDVDGLRQALAAARRRHPLLGVRLDREREALVVDASDGIPLEVLDREGPGHWERVAESELARPFEAGTGPLARARLLQGDDASDVLLTFHHAVGDGLAGLYLLREVLGGGGGSRPVPLPVLPPYEEMVPPGARDAWQWEGGSPDGLGVDGQARAQWTPRLCSVGLDASGVEDLAASCRAEDVGVNAALGAALVLAVAHELCPGDEAAFTCTCPVDVRGRLRGDGAADGSREAAVGEDFGVFVADVAASVSVSASTRFWELARRIHRHVAAGVDGDALFTRQGRLVKQILRDGGADALEAMARFAPTRVGLTNVGRIVVESPGPFGEVTGLHFLSTPPGAQLVLSVATGPQGLVANLVYPEPHVGAGAAQRIASAVARRLAAAARDPRLVDLSPARRRLLERRLDARTGGQEEGTLFPLSEGQRALWILHRLDPESAAYVQPFAAWVRSPLERPRMEAALAALARRHPSLRTVFQELDGEPFQRVLTDPELPLEWVDGSGWSRARTDAWIAEAYARPFDPRVAPPWRAWVVEGGEDGPLLFLTLHHLIYDFWSLLQLVDELRALYATAGDAEAAGLPEPRADYRSFVFQQRRLLASPEGDRLKAYWIGALAGGVPPLELPTDRVRPPTQTFAGGAFRVELPGDVADGVRALARERGVTLFTVLVALGQSFLHRWSGQDRFAVGSPTAGRLQGEYAGVVGDFVNPVALVADFSGGPTFNEHLDRTRRTVLGTLDHQAYPFTRVVADARPPRDPGRSPIFQAMVVFQNQVPHLLGRRAPEPEGGRAAAAELVLEGHEVPLQGAQVDLSLEFDDVEGLGLTWKYAELFHEGTVRTMAESFVTLSRAALATPEAAVADLPIVTDEERQRARDEWHATGKPLPEGTVLDLVEERAATHPHRPAVGQGGRVRTYAQVVAAARILADRLRATGVRPGDSVGISVRRSEHVVATLLGVMASGAAYVPLDPAFPGERLRLMVRDAGVRVAVTDAPVEDGAGVGWLDGVVRVPPVTDSGDDLVGRIGESLPAPDDLAYVMYTSGSTGTPKGVEIPHGALVAFLEAMKDATGLGGDDVLLAVTTLSFDISLLELFLPLLVGGRVEVLESELVADGPAMRRRLEESGATAMQATPSTWRLLLGTGWTPPSGLRVLCGGEALDRPLADALTAGGAELINLYGPTETTVWSAVHRVAPGEDPVPIGRPIANTRLHVMDAEGRPVPAGIPGELWIAGAGVARGYRGREEETARRFVPEPGGRPGARAYRTGDRVRRRADGVVEFLGRLDRQVKLRGFRIEPGEVEAALLASAEVAEAAVVVRGEGAQAHLVAYVTAPAGHPEPDAATVRAELRARLPEYMVPSFIVPLEALPRTPNEKLDRGALPDPAAVLRPADSGGEDATATPLHERLRAIWCAVLELESVGLRENFFDVGGHSLALAKVQARIRSELGREVPMVELFRSPTLDALARRLEEGSDGGPEEDERLEAAQARGVRRGESRSRQAAARARARRGE